MEAYCRDHIDNLDVPFQLMPAAIAGEAASRLVVVRKQGLRDLAADFRPTIDPPTSAKGFTSLLSNRGACLEWSMYYGCANTE